MPLKELTSPSAPWLLNALQFQGRSNDCGSYTTATVLNALTGSEINGIELANQMDKPVWRGPLFVVRRVPNWATFPWGIVDIIRSSGLEASWQLFSSANQLTSALRGRRIVMPIIGSRKPLWAHVMTLVAWHYQLGWGFANTQYNHHHIDWLDDQVFQRHWKALGRLMVYVHVPE
jgi:hypothetical protein